MDENTDAFTRLMCFGSGSHYISLIFHSIIRQKYPIQIGNVSMRACWEFWQRLENAVGTQNELITSNSRSIKKEWQMFTVCGLFIIFDHRGLYCNVKKSINLLKNRFLIILALHHVHVILRMGLTAWYWTKVVQHALCCITGGNRTTFVQLFWEYGSKVADFYNKCTLRKASSLIIHQCFVFL